jgi:hypothetical protein
MILTFVPKTFNAVKAVFPLQVATSTLPIPSSSARLAAASSTAFVFFTPGLSKYRQTTSLYEIVFAIKINLPDDLWS